MVTRWTLTVRSKVELDSRPTSHTWRGCRTATLVALRQLHDLPVARENCGSECDHQMIISEMLIGVKENLSKTLRPVLCASATSYQIVDAGHICKKVNLDEFHQWTDSEKPHSNT